MARKDLEHEISNQLAKEMAEEMDRQLMWGWLKEAGWTYVKLERFKDNFHAVDIACWIDENRTSEVLRAGTEFLFKESKDATMFILRWSE